MINISRRYAQHIDDLRAQKKVTITDLCTNVCSRRSYLRYVNGERPLPNDTLYKFCEKLKISPNDFYFSFLSNDQKEFQDILGLYDLIVQKEHSTLKVELKKRLNSMDQLNALSKKVLEYINTRYLLETKQITRLHAIDLMNKIINYPECLKGTLFDFGDVLCLIKLSDLQSNNEHQENILSLLENILIDDSFRFISPETRMIMPDLYATLAISFGRLDKLDKCLTVAEIGIKQSIESGVNNALTQLYYAKALSLLKTGRVNEGMVYAGKCLSNTITRNDKRRLKLYKQLLLDDFKVDPYELIKHAMLDE